MEICWYCKKVVEGEPFPFLHSDGFYFFHSAGTGCVVRSLAEFVEEQLANGGLTFDNGEGAA